MKVTFFPKDPLFLETLGKVQVDAHIFILRLFMQTRAILHDASTFDDPEKFDPNRFLAADGTLDSNAPDVSVAFGYGRRICPVCIYKCKAVICALTRLLSML